MKLAARYVEKPWGRTGLPPIFESVAGRRIGEIWFPAGPDAPLLAKYLFTSERLSVQVHPDDEQAKARRLPHGKAECWYVLEAEPESTIGLGLRDSFTRDEVRKAALDGSIVEAMDWRSVKAGDFFYVPPGTVHAIGAGISLLEFQQNSDVTYRLYDYGRPRELHLDDAVAVSILGAYPEGFARHIEAGEDAVLVDRPPFTLIHARSDRLKDRRRWVLPLEGRVRCNGEQASAGECLLVDAGEELEIDDARLLIGAAG
ncbi:MAG TPA: type I phosphomannose isomerase catalytic subunit [Sphingomicrobium sp.]|nr:type I phosphomannose isomerase catalytic subunit [Sphingomicrobium sp.]